LTTYLSKTVRASARIVLHGHSPRRASSRSTDREQKKLEIKPVPAVKTPENLTIHFRKVV